MRPGSGHSRSSVMRPNWTPPAYEMTLTPTPTSPDDGTQKMLWRTRAPQNARACAGPATFVMTAVVLSRNQLESACWPGFGSTPDNASSSYDSSGW